ncbi:sporulation protein YqfD [Alicyclobacillus sp.]|uniref:sporulation protein YqfD n=1 Tax=Alicyclobacillus sp. TaxID=61169 RepID=UPI0025C2B82F|nr:sporulation protein YqfD [Alicyclobacillus sp.]MCL6516353.1 sporulation protein YqfD [Alicyclobacillus sp.]
MRTPGWPGLPGWLTLELRGEDIPAVLAACANRGMRLSAVRVRGERCTLTLSLGDYREFYPICRRHRVRFRVLARQGPAFTARRARRRPAFFLSAALFVAVVYACGSVVWQVDVGGQVSEEGRMALLEAARDSGLRPGVWKGSLPDALTLQAEILRRAPSMLWVGVEMDGAKARLEAIERVPGPEVKPASPHNLVAARPGVIRHVFATRGQVVVRPGQVVQPGQILVSGSLGGGAAEVPAEGRVMAEVWYTSHVEVPLTVGIEGLTGQTAERGYLVVGPWAIHVWGWRMPTFTAHAERADESDWHLGAWRLPVQWRNVTLFEATESQVSLDEAAARARALELAAQDVRRQMGEGGVLGQTVLQSRVDHGKLYATVLTRTEEDIGVPAPIPKTEASSDGARA